MEPPAPRRLPAEEPCQSDDGGEELGPEDDRDDADKNVDVAHGEVDVEDNGRRGRGGGLGYAAHCRAHRVAALVHASLRVVDHLELRHSSATLTVDRDAFDEPATGDGLAATTLATETEPVAPTATAVIRKAWQAGGKATRSDERGPKKQSGHAKECTKDAEEAFAAAMRDENDPPRSEETPKLGAPHGGPDTATLSSKPREMLAGAMAVSTSTASCGGRDASCCSVGSAVGSRDVVRSELLNLKLRTWKKQAM